MSIDGSTPTSLRPATVPPAELAQTQFGNGFWLNSHAEEFADAMREAALIIVKNTCGDQDRHGRLTHNIQYENGEGIGIGRDTLVSPVKPELFGKAALSAQGWGSGNEPERMADHRVWINGLSQLGEPFDAVRIRAFELTYRTKAGDLTEYSSVGIGFHQPGQSQEEVGLRVRSNMVPTLSLRRDGRGRKAVTETFALGEQQDDGNPQPEYLDALELQAVHPGLVDDLIATMRAARFAVAAELRPVGRTEDAWLKMLNSPRAQAPGRIARVLAHAGGLFGRK